MASTKFFAMIKPDGVKRGLVGEILKRFEKRNFLILALRYMDPNENSDLIDLHYADHRDKKFHKDLITFMLSGPIIGMILFGNINVAKQIIGPTIPWDAQPGTIRGDFTTSLPQNLIHCSDNEEKAIKEVDLWEKFLKN